MRVIPNAKKTEFGGYRAGELILRVAAPPHEGKANKTAVAFVADYFSVSHARVSLVSGEKSRHKIFQIVGLEKSDLERKLTELNH